MQRRLAQQGFVLIALLVLLTMGGLYYFVGNLTPESVEARRQEKTSLALAEARDALIGYALTYRERVDGAMYGFLPMPDVGTSRFNSGQQNPSCNTEGCAMDFINGAFPSSSETVVGRLPWRTLGIAPLLDGYGECLWYLVSAGHKSLGIDANLPMNWDTLGHIDIVTTTDTADLKSRISSPHDRPVVIIFSPGPLLEGQQRGKVGSDDVTHCQGNYNPANYLEPDLAATILDNDANSTSAYFSGGIASVTSSTSLAAISTQGKIFKDGGNLKTSCPHQTNCSLVANDVGLDVTSDVLFGAIRKNKSFRESIKQMLDRMATCWSTGANLASLTPASITDYTPPADKVAGRIPDAPSSCNSFIDTAYGNSVDPKGYFDNYRDMIFIARPQPASGTFTVNGDPTCKGVLVFSGPRSSGKQRVTAADKKTLGNYLEGDNLASFTALGTTFSGDSTAADDAPVANGTDIAVCIPNPPTGPSLVESSALTSLGVGQLVSYNTDTRTLTLGRADAVTGEIGSANAGALFGCAWIEDNVALGNGARIYFRFQFKEVGTSVGLNGFTFAVADAESNSTSSCGATGSQLGYSGNNGSTPTISFPKIGFEFDQSRNSNFNENLNNPRRNDPCGTTADGCAGLGYNSHAAIVYWGNELANPTDMVTLPDNDDNVHGFPASPPAIRPPPINPNFPSPGFAFTDMRGKSALGGDSNIFHVRVELQPTRNIATSAENSTTVFQTKAWILADSATVTNQIAAMRNTTAAMSVSYPTLSPTLQDTATVFDVAETGSSCNTDSPCPTDRTCGSDNICYRPAMKTLQLGFTGSQRTTDQEVEIADFIATRNP